MEVVQLAADLYFFRMPIGHVYLWRDPDGLTLIDAGAPGCAPRIADAIGDLGHDPTDVRRLVLTHGHVDHIGAAAEIASWGQVIVLAHRAEAPIIRGKRRGRHPSWPTGNGPSLLGSARSYRLDLPRRYASTTNSTTVT